MKKYSIYLSGLAIAIFLCGCATDKMLQEPDAIPAYVVEYTTSRLGARTSGIPVAIDLEDCVESAMISSRGLSGGTSTLGFFPVKTVVRRELERIVSDNFRMVLPEEQPMVELKVSSALIVVRESWSNINCEMELQFELLNPHHNDKPYFSRIYKRQCKGRLENKRIVPLCVYETVQKIIKKFVDDVSKDPSLAARLESLSPSGESRLLKAASLKALSFGAENNGLFPGKCEVLCNDWEGFKTDKWARRQIEESCRMKLGIEEERVRVVFLNEQLDESTKTWKYEFAAFPRSKIVLNYNPATRVGSCIADMGLLGLSEEKTSELMKRYIVREMNSRAGLADSGAKAAIRYDSFKTDSRYGLLIVTFRNVY
jgi:hypothetical protein